MIRLALLDLAGMTPADALERALVSEHVEITSLDQADLTVYRTCTAPRVTDPPLQSPFMVLIAGADTRLVVQWMRAGALDVLVLPLDKIQWRNSINELQGHLPSRNLNAPIRGMIGDSPAMRALFAQIHKVAPVESTVLIQGESGTGKELVARAIHANSTRRGEAMISLNCAAIPETLVESELFGHERGAFTGANHSRRGLIEAADRGTLFLDEIGELPLDAQARLLRVLQEGEIRRLGSIQTRKVNVRLIAATHRDLRQLIETGRFREDLYYRLNVVTLAVPPLRERPSDLPELVRFVLDRTCAKLAKPILQIDDGAMRAILHHSWPGNVRELENAIERAVILADGPIIGEPLLAIEPFRRQPAIEPASATPLEEKTSLDDYFITFVTQHQDSLSETEIANRLGISRKSLWERRQRFGIPRTRTKSRTAASDAGF